jgi:hypothetical protein
MKKGLVARIWDDIYEDVQELRIIHRLCSLLFDIRGQEPIPMMIMNISECKTGSNDHERVRMPRLPVFASNRTTLHHVPENEQEYRFFGHPSVVTNSDGMVKFAASYFKPFSEVSPEPVDHSQHEACTTIEPFPEYANYVELRIIISLPQVEEIHKKWVASMQLAVLTALVRRGLPRHPLYDSTIWRLVFEAAWTPKAKKPTKRLVEK